MDNLVENEIEARGEFASVFANKLKEDPQLAGLLTGLPFERFARILLVDCDLDLDFVTTSQLYKHFK